MEFFNDSIIYWYVSGKQLHLPTFFVGISAVFHHKPSLTRTVFFLHPSECLNCLPRKIIYIRFESTYTTVKLDRLDGEYYTYEAALQRPLLYAYDKHITVIMHKDCDKPGRFYAFTLYQEQYGLPRSLSYNTPGDQFAEVANEDTPITAL